MIRSAPLPILLLLLALGAAACGGEERQAPAGPEAAEAPEAPAAEPEAASAGPQTPANLPNGLLVAISKFEAGEGGKPLPRSELLVLVRKDGEWRDRHFEDPESNVFHKAFVWTPPNAAPGIVTLGGSAAAVKFWRPDPTGELRPERTLWEADFGGKFSRMRDAEAADLYGNGREALAVATHDQGVVAVLRPEADGSVEVEELDREADTFIHEIEIGDLDADGVLEVYATPSEPNRLDGTPQKGKVVRYVPAKGEGRETVADLGDRHAKEILVDDVDGDGRDELYVSIEAAEGGDLEIRRYEADTPSDGGTTVATLSDPMARFLTAGDVEGDGSKEMVVAAKDTGLWLLRPGEDPTARWRVELVDADSKGFEHAALLADLDGDGADELYVASDDDREIRRYVWTGDGFARETILHRDDPLPVLTWNLMPMPLGVLEP
jgi:hypothetical protein